LFNLSFGEIRLLAISLIEQLQLPSHKLNLIEPKAWQPILMLVMLDVSKKNLIDRE
jgi:hypothetical protein